MEDDYVQLVGATCPVCGERIATERSARACAACKAPVHRACAAKHGCVPQPAQATPPTPPKRRFVPYLGAAVGVALASSLAPMVHDCRQQSFIRARAARDLSCSADEVTVTIRGDEVRADGCHDYVTYLVGCRPITKDECLVMDHIPSGQVNDMIEHQLHLR